MTLRPVDMQVIVPKVTEVGKQQQVQNLAPDQQQHFLGQQGQVEADHRQKTVQSSPQSEEGRIRERQQNKQGRQQGKSKSGRRDQDEQEESVPQDPLRGRLLDIKI
ncbi:hypothetical protein H1S01_02805 [Heliobacterium chlorum]|uniref:Uncharacterized protein n=1 Tax=Heliobacterium chlorum TaxID=2698 RepID=A0ABR7T025_HELCL|nr:hypothetical protein [Heliobacterium chlorum]MBC9783442.1 hypothetical protein [Heliobacterium chlorum]